MIRRNIHWFIAILLVVFVVGACVVRSRPAPRGRPVYVQPDKHNHGHDKHKHKKHHDNRRH
jgi:hypothetical protein